VTADGSAGDYELAECGLSETAYNLARIDLQPPCSLSFRLAEGSLVF